MKHKICVFLTYSIKTKIYECKSISSGALLLQQLGGWYHAMVQVCPQSTLTTLATYRGDMQCVPTRGAHYQLPVLG